MAFHSTPNASSSPKQSQVLLVALGKNSILPLYMVSLPISWPEESVITLWTASTIEPSSSSTLFSSPEINRNCQFSKFHSAYSWRGKGDEIHWKNNTCKIIWERTSPSALATSPSWLCSILFRYSNTEHSPIVSRTLQSKIPAGRTVKKSCMIYEMGQTKRAMQKKRGQPRAGFLLNPSTSTDVHSLWETRVSSQKIHPEYNQVWTQRWF